MNVDITDGGENNGGGENENGGSTLHFADQGTAYIQSTGSDENGDGTPEKPFLTGQPAVNAGYRSFRIGFGHNAGNLDFRSAVTFGQFFISIGSQGAENGVNVSDVLFNPNSSPVVRLIGAASVSTMKILGEPGSSGNVNGGQGGQLYLYIDPTARVFNNMDASGGDGFDDGNGTPAGGGNGGLINITGPGFVQDALVNGGSAVNGGISGIAGTVGGTGFNIAGTFHTGPSL